ncbi:hypothetical protein PHISP_06636 [Aspergillus sp. HF37]|nr:hypothetical protein PHISP_06636 [Aspergillus sp. HF37]
MSQQNPPAASPADALREESRSSVDQDKPPLQHEQPGSSPRSGEQDPGPSQPALHPSAPVEPPLEPTHVRSIGVHSILNPPSSAAAADLAGYPGGGGEGLGLQPGGPPSRSRQASILTDHPAAHQGRRLSQSPGFGQRNILAPASPSARFVRGTSRNHSYSGQASASHSPLVHGSRPGLYNAAAPGPSLPVDPVTGSSPSMVGTHPTTSAAHHSMPPLSSPRISTGQATNPSSHEASPRTPHATYNQFGRSSPAVANMPVPHPAPSFHPGYATDPLTRFPSAAGGKRYMADEAQQGSSSSSSSGAFLQGKIPLYLDMKSGTSAQAAKRKANSDASRRFRLRKHNGKEMEQKVRAQEDEIRRQSEEIHALVRERDHYRSERDFYRDHAARALPLAQLPARPPSPRPFRSELAGDMTWRGVDAPRPDGHLAQPAPYLAAPVSYAERGTAPDEQRPLPQPPKSWTSA